MVENPNISPVCPLSWGMFFTSDPAIIKKDIAQYQSSWAVLSRKEVIPMDKTHFSAPGCYRIRVEEAFS